MFRCEGWEDRRPLGNGERLREKIGTLPVVVAIQEEVALDQAIEGVLIDAEDRLLGLLVYDVGAFKGQPAVDDLFEEAACFSRGVGIDCYHQ